MDEKEKEKLDKLNARYKRQNEAIKEKYERIGAVLPKGTKERIQATGNSINGFIVSAVLEKLNRIETNRKAAPDPAPVQQSTEDMARALGWIE